MTYIIQEVKITEMFCVGMIKQSCFHNNYFFFGLVWGGVSGTDMTHWTVRVHRAARLGLNPIHIVVLWSQKSGVGTKPSMNTIYNFYKCAHMLVWKLVLVVNGKIRSKPQPQPPTAIRCSALHTRARRHDHKKFKKHFWPSVYISFEF